MKYQAAAAAAIFMLSAAALAGAGEHGHGHGAATAEGGKEQTAWGIPGDARRARTIQVSMTDDMRFTPDRIHVRQGDTIRFVVRNKGKILHELVLGTQASLQEHAALMAKFPDMEHEEAHMAHVAPGRTATLAWTFNRPGEFQFACLVAGHYEAGMKGAIRVAGRAPEPGASAVGAPPARKP